MSADRSRSLIGRTVELARLQALLSAAREGTSSSVVVIGPAGVGKTSLVEAAIAGTREVQVMSVVGIEAELELPYGGLHRLLYGFPHIQGRLPAPQQNAIDNVFGLRSDGAPDPFLTGLATLTLLADAARERPLVCFVDDVQWLDAVSLRALGFVARRLLAEGIVLLFGARAMSVPPDLAGLPTLQLGGLADTAARQLLISAAPTIASSVAARLVALTGGNPLALQELPRQLTPGQLDSSRPLPVPLPLSDQLSGLFSHAIEQVSEPARRLLVLAAVSATDDATALLRAAAADGLSAEQIEAARDELAELLTLAPTVRFRHPLIRSNVLALAPTTAHRHAHEVVASVLDPVRDPDRRAWHLGAAAAGPDDSVAQELERSAERARTRGGYSVEAQFLARAADLSGTSQASAVRTLKAAEAAILAGEPRWAGSLLDAAVDGLSTPELEAQWQLHRGTLLLTAGDGECVPALRRAAELLQSQGHPKFKDFWLLALHAVVQVSQRIRGTEAQEIALAARAAGRLNAGSADALTANLLEGIAGWMLDDYSAAAAASNAALNSVSVNPEPTIGYGVRAIFLTRVAMETFEYNKCLRLLHIMADRDQSYGALEDFRIDLYTIISLGARAGHLKMAKDASDRLTRVMHAMGGDVVWQNDSLEILTASGQTSEALQLADAILQETISHGRGSQMCDIYGWRALLHTTNREYEKAAADARAAVEIACPGLMGTTYPRLVESLVRIGETEEAKRALDEFAVRAEAAATPLSLGLLAMCRGLTAEADTANEYLSQAVALTARSNTPLEAGYAQLVHGEWLRRNRRRSDAAAALEAANDQFTAIGAQALAARAGAELGAAGSRPLRRSPESRDVLTGQELQVARGAASGLSNREIAVTMFLSEATVAYHLKSVFRKLDITSRRQLRDHQELAP